MQLTDEENLMEIYRALRRVGDITDSYLYPYCGVPLQLEPVNVEIQNIMFLLTSIVEEGNGPADKVVTDKAATENRTDGEGGLMEQQVGNAPRNEEDRSRTQPHDAASANEHDLDTDDFVLEDPLARPPTPHNPHAPTWKQSLPHLPQARLYVGPTERRMFQTVLALAVEVQAALVAVVRLCEALHAKGLAMQQVWESWRVVGETLHRKRRAETEEPKPTGYEMGG